MFSVEKQIISEITPVYAKPTFDINKGLIAKNLAQSTLSQLGLNPGEYPALIEAGALAFYDLTTRFSSASDLKRLKNRQRRLTQSELSATARTLLPTVGIEIEIPFVGGNNFNLYADIFEALGFTPNQANVSTFHKYFEISSSPSSSSLAQMQIINGLIKTELLPSLTSSKDPADIRQHLSDCLVSLHISLGSPIGISKNLMKSLDDAEASPKLYPWMISAALGLAYTSPLRLQYRKYCEDINLNKELIKTTRNETNGMKIELRALEVRDQSVYELPLAAQILGMLYFSKAAPENKDLADIAKYFTHELETFFSDNKVNEQTMQSKKESAAKAHNLSLVIGLKKLIKSTRLAVSGYLKAA